MSYENDPEIMAAVNRLAMAQLGEAIKADTGGDADALERARRAAIEICKRAGILDVLRSVSADGVLRPPPPWPSADIVPTGGGPGYLDVSVRTFDSVRGLLSVPLRMALDLGQPKSKTQEQIGEAFELGRWRLKKWIAG